MSGTLVSGVIGQPSPSRAERRTPWSFIAPIQIGGCGSCHGRMWVRPSSRDQNSPEKETTSWVHICFMIPIASSNIAEALGVVDAECGELVLAVAGAGADHEAAAGEDVEGRQVLGEHHRVVERHLDHGRRERHVLVELRRDPGQGGDRLEPAQVAVEEVLAHRDVREAVALRCLDLPQEAVEMVARRHAAVDVAEDHADLHWDLRGAVVIAITPYHMHEY